MGLNFDKLDENSRFFHIAEFFNGHFKNHAVMLGGSHRFTYHDREPNDLDLFIWADLNEIRQFERTWEVRPSYNDSYDVASIKIRVYMMGVRVDLNFYPLESDFNNLVHEHWVVESTLENNIVLRNVLRNLYMSGVKKYRAILVGARMFPGSNDEV